MADKQQTTDAAGKAILLIALLTLPVLILFAVQGRFSQGTVAWQCLTVVVVLAWYEWDLRKSVCFWIAIAFMLLLQLPIVFYVPWRVFPLGKAFAFFAFADFAVGLGLMKIVKILDNSKDKAGAQIQ